MWQKERGVKPECHFRKEEYVENGRWLVDSIMIDWDYDGVVMERALRSDDGSIRAQLAIAKA